MAREAIRIRDRLAEIKNDVWAMDRVLGTRLRQVLLNLLTNAVKFTERGTIKIDVSYRSATGILRLAVTDSGIGIPADQVPLLFERFSQADTSTTRRYGGTGLGLAISKHLVELMGGQISIKTQVGTGSCFWFELPLSQAAFASSSPSLEHILPESRGYRVLLAEDNLINQEIIDAMLTKRGHAVTVVADGAAAVAAIETGRSFDLVLMDVQMPGMDGFAATRAVRRLEQAQGRRRLSIIGLTANAMDVDVVRCIEVGMDGHVAKPIDWPSLFESIDNVMAASRVLGPALGHVA